MGTVEALKATYELLRDRDHWAQGHSGFTREGRPVGWEHPDAYAYCLTGAAARASKGDEATLNRVYTAIHGALDSYEALWKWNDHPRRMHVEVLEALGKAIDAETAKEDALFDTLRRELALQ